MNGTPPRPRDGARGRWLVVGIIGLAILLGLVAMRYRKFTPKPAPRPATQPTERAVAP